MPVWVNATPNGGPGGGGGGAPLSLTANRIPYAVTASTLGDSPLFRAGADTVQQSRLANAQTFNLYNTTDSDSAPVNYERGFFRYSANVLQIGHEGAGTGSNTRAVSIRTAGFSVVTFTNTSAQFGVNIAGGISIGTAVGDRITGLFGTGGFMTGISTTKTTGYTATTTDFTIPCDATSGAFTVTLPASASNTGRIYNIKKIDASANAVTIDGNGAETIDGSATKALATQWANLMIQSDGTNWLIIG